MRQLAELSIDFVMAQIAKTVKRLMTCQLSMCDTLPVCMDKHVCFVALLACRQDLASSFRRRVNIQITYIATCCVCHITIIDC